MLNTLFCSTNLLSLPFIISINSVRPCIALAVVKQRRFIIFTGYHFCQVSSALYCPCPTASRAKLSCYFHPQRNGTGRKVRFTLALFCFLFLQNYEKQKLMVPQSAVITFQVKLFVEFPNKKRFQIQSKPYHGGRHFHEKKILISVNTVVEY